MKSAIIVAAMLISLISISAMANPPHTILMNYDDERQELYITIEHQSSDRKTHFIKEVVVYKNAGEVFRRSFDFQTGLRSQTVPPVKIAGKKGDVIKVVATCNKFGSGGNSLVIGE